MLSEVRANVSQDKLVNIEREPAQAGALNIVSFTDAYPFVTSFLTKG